MQVGDTENLMKPGKLSVVKDCLWGWELTITVVKE